MKLTFSYIDIFKKTVFYTIKEILEKKFVVTTSRFLIGFSHSAFTFAYESLVVKSSVAQTAIPPGALITFLQKGLEYIAIEEHINEVCHTLYYF